MQVADIMTAPAVSVAPESGLQSVVGTMLEHRVGSVVVRDTGLVGIVTRSDVLRAVYHLGKPLTDLAVTEVMSTDVVTSQPTDPVDTALGRMEEYNVKKLPVVEEFSVIGIVTTTDIARHQPNRVREVRDSLERRDEWTD